MSMSFSFTYCIVIVNESGVSKTLCLCNNNVIILQEELKRDRKKCKLVNICFKIDKYKHVLMFVETGRLIRIN